MKQLQGVQFSLRNGDPIEDLRLGGSVARSLSTSTGEINAWDKKDATRVISQLMAAMASGDIQQAAPDQAELRAKRMAVLSAAYHDPEKWAALGSSIALQLQEQRAREGFLRRLAVGVDLKIGDQARIAMPSWDQVAVVATSAANVGYQPVRSKVFNPPEFELVATPRVAALDLAQIGPDLLDEAYNQASDSIIVQEDRLWKKAADKTVGLVNPLEYISGELTPKILGRLRQAVSDWNLPVRFALISNDYWSDIVGNAEWAQFFDPVTKYDLVLNGNIGTLIGMELITDAFRQPNQKVLNRGEIYVVSSPENHGAYTDRGGITSTPTNGADQGSTSKGWLLSEAFSFVLASPRSVAKGQRI